ncbi:MAG: hypothetical protein LBT42_04870 [Tannerella sp.]|jgi:Spy/CpxP family protein refolding chaperone|nr:hypothetical protein [Tannerella sp.]
MKKLFVVSFMLMFAFMVSAQDRQRGGGQGDMTARYAELKKDLKLSDQQVDSLKAIDTEVFAKMRDLREESGGDRDKMRELMTKVNEKRDERVKAILSKEQFDKYKESEAQRRQRGGGGGGGGNR